MKFYRHNKTKGIYRLIGECRIESTNTLGVMYEDILTETIWVRPKSEFFDGRFSKFKIEDIKDGM